VLRESLTPPAYGADVVARTSFAPPHGLVICGPGCVPSWCLGWGIAPPLPPPAVRIARRMWKEIERLTHSNVWLQTRS
jgi:hypothetical protein